MTALIIVGNLTAIIRMKREYLAITQQKDNNIRDLQQHIMYGAPLECVIDFVTGQEKPA